MDAKIDTDKIRLELIRLIMNLPDAAIQQIDSHLMAQVANIPQDARMN